MMMEDAVATGHQLLSSAIEFDLGGKKLPRDDDQHGKRGTKLKTAGNKRLPEINNCREIQSHLNTSW